MRTFYLNRSLLLIALTLPLLASCGRTSSQDGLGRIAFQCLKNNDFERLSKLMIRRNEALAVLETLRRSEQFSGYSNKQKRRFISVQKNMESLLKKHKEALRQNFLASFDYGVKKGIVWSKTKFLRVELAHEDFIFDLEQLPHQHIYIIFQSGKQEHRLRLRNAIKVNRGWVMVDGFSWHDNKATSQSGLKKAKP